MKEPLLAKKPMLVIVMFRLGVKTLEVVWWFLCWSQKVSLYPADSGAERGTRHFGPENYSSSATTAFPNSGRKNSRSRACNQRLPVPPVSRKGGQRPGKQSPNFREVFSQLKIEREKRKKCLREDYCMLYDIGITFYPLLFDTL